MGWNPSPPSSRLPKGCPLCRIFDYTIGSIGLAQCVSAWWVVFRAANFEVSYQVRDRACASADEPGHSLNVPKSLIRS